MRRPLAAFALFTEAAITIRANAGLTNGESYVYTFDAPIALAAE